MEDVKIKRRNYFIKKGFQAKFIAIFLVLIVVGYLFLGWIIYRVSNQELAKSFYKSHLQIKSTWEIIFPAVLVATLLAVFVTSIVAILVGMFASHRIAGPLYRFEKTLDEIGKGNLTVKTKLRDTDELKTLADKFNKVNQELNSRLKIIKEEVEQLSKSFKELDQSADKKIPGGTSVNKEIQEKLEKVNKIISQFNL